MSYKYLVDPNRLFRFWERKLRRNLPNHKPSQRACFSKTFGKFGIPILSNLLPTTTTTTMAMTQKEKDDERSQLENKKSHHLGTFIPREKQWHVRMHHHVRWIDEDERVSSFWFDNGERRKEKITGNLCMYRDHRRPLSSIHFFRFAPHCRHVVCGFFLFVLLYCMMDKVVIVITTAKHVEATN